MIVLVGHDNAKIHLGAIARALRDRGVLASCYFDDKTANLPGTLDTSSIGFLLVGLSKKVSCDETHPGHNNEKKLLEWATEGKIPCGVVHDAEGHISAPYLKDLGPKVKLAIAREPHPGIPATELRWAARAIYIQDIVTNAAVAARAILEVIRS